jgi:hypothetical protein
MSPRNVVFGLSRINTTRATTCDNPGQVGNKSCERSCEHAIISTNPVLNKI